MSFFTAGGEIAGSLNADLWRVGKKRMTDEKAATGIVGLDEVLRGGLPLPQMYFIQGDPGAGKTTLSFQFLLEGVRRGERALYVTLSASKQDLERVARSHGWDISGIDIYEQFQTGGATHTTIFRPAEIELGKTVHAILDVINERAPDRVVIDSLGEIRLLSESSLRYRKQLGIALRERERVAEIQEVCWDSKFERAAAVLRTLQDEGTTFTKPHLACA